MPKNVFILSPWSSLTSMGKGGYQGLYNTVKLLIDAKFEVHFFCPQKSLYKMPLERKSYPEFGNKFHIHKFWMPFQTKKTYLKYMGHIHSARIYFAFNLTATLSLLKASKKYNPNLIYATGADGVPSVFLISKILKIPSITKLFGTFLYPRINSKFRLLLGYKEVLAFKIPCDLLIILNDGTHGDEVAKSLKVPPERIRFWMDGVNKKRYDQNFNVDLFKESIGIPANSKVILSVSRLEKWKGVHRLVNSIPTIISKVNAVVFCICGDGSEREELEKLCEKLGVRNYVKFMGAVDYDKLQNFYNMADIFVSLYDLSNVGNPLLEAISCGKCIVTLNVGSTNQLIKNRENGILLEPDNLIDLPDTIIKLLNDDELRNRMGRNAKNYAFSHFQTWEERMNMELEEIKELIQMNNNSNCKHIYMGQKVKTKSPKSKKRLHPKTKK